ncbi:MAG: hypothetical protein JEZ08_08325 [Clostridiales bacterium]|nr:hypothetical protein [Clostridiales bacterium]
MLDLKHNLFGFNGFFDFKEASPVNKVTCPLYGAKLIAPAFLVTQEI